MVIKVSIPNRFQFKTAPSFKTMLFQREGEVHYIGGADILPAPLDGEEEAKLIQKLGQRRRPRQSQLSLSTISVLWCT